MQHGVADGTPPRAGDALPSRVGRAPAANCRALLATSDCISKLFIKSSKNVDFDLTHSPAARCIHRTDGVPEPARPDGRPTRMTKVRKGKRTQLVAEVEELHAHLHRSSASCRLSCQSTGAHPSRRFSNGSQCHRSRAGAAQCPQFCQAGSGSLGIDRAVVRRGTHEQRVTRRPIQGPGQEED